MLQTASMLEESDPIESFSSIHWHPPISIYRRVLNFLLGEIFNIYLFTHSFLFLQFSATKSTPHMLGNCFLVKYLLFWILPHNPIFIYFLLSHFSMIKAQGKKLQQKPCFYWTYFVQIRRKIKSLIVRWMDRRKLRLVKRAYKHVLVNLQLLLSCVNLCWKKFIISFSLWCIDSIL